MLSLELVDMLRSVGSRDPGRRDLYLSTQQCSPRLAQKLSGTCADFSINGESQTVTLGTRLKGEYPYGNLTLTNPLSLPAHFVLISRRLPIIKSSDPKDLLGRYFKPTPDAVGRVGGAG